MFNNLSNIEAKEERTLLCAYLFAKIRIFNIMRTSLQKHGGGGCAQHASLPKTGHPRRDLKEPMAFRVPSVGLDELS
jgi:hypothetical protein